MTCYPWQVCRRHFHWATSWASPPTFLFSRGTNRLLCPVGHLLYKRRLFAWQTLYKNKNHAQNKHPECQHCTHRKRQTKAFASPRRTARETSDSAGRVEQVFPRAVFPGTTGRCGLLSLGKPAVAISAGRRAGHRPLQIYLFMKDKTTPLPCRASRTERSPLSPTVTFPHPVGNHLYKRRLFFWLPNRGAGKP